MKLPRHPALPYVGLALVAYLSGDLCSALLEQQFRFTPQRSPKAVEMPAALNGIRLPGELNFILSNRASGQDGDLPTDAPTQAAESNGTAVPSTRPPGTSPGAALPVLAGTLEGQGASLAVLQMGQETRVVGVGEEWLGFVLLEVAPFQVRVRDNRGQEHTLSMQLAQASAAPQPLAQATSSSVPANNSWANQFSPSASPVLTSRELRSMLDDQGWIKHILVRPFQRDNETIGVQVNYSNPNNPFPKLGIQSGDIVMTLNTRPLKAMEDMGTVLMELRNATSLNFEIERGGQVIQHSVNLDP